MIKIKILDYLFAAMVVFAILFLIAIKDQNPPIIKRGVKEEVAIIVPEPITLTPRGERFEERVIILDEPLPILPSIVNEYGELIEEANDEPTEEIVITPEEFEQGRADGWD